MDEPLVAADDAAEYPPGFARRAVLRLSTIEIWERYSFFTLFAMLALYATSPSASGGLGWDKPAALRFFGLYLIVVQVAPLLGGVIVDRWLTASRALRIGATMLLLGHLLMAMPALIGWAAPHLFGPAANAITTVPLGSWTQPGLPPEAVLPYRLITVAFYLAIAFVAVGNGLFKPVLTVVVGRLPHASALDRDRAFSTFFVFINIGGLFSVILGGWLATRFGWGWVFAGAALGMAVARLSIAHHRRAFIDPFAGQVHDSPERRAAGAPERPWRGGIAFILAILLIASIFTYQSYGFVSLFTESYVDRSIAGFTVPTPWFTALNPITIMVLAPVLIAIAARGWLGGERTGVPRLSLTFALLASAFALLAAVMPPAGELAPAPALALAVIILAASELTSTPVVNSVITRLAPPRLQTLAIGASGAAVGIGAWLSGQVGAVVISGDIRQALFAIAGAAAAVGILVTLAGRKLTRVGI